MNRDRIGLFDVWGRGHRVRVESALGEEALIERLRSAVGRPLAGPLEIFMPDLNPAQPLQGIVTGPAVRLRAPRTASIARLGYRPQLIGAVQARSEGGSAIVGTIRLAVWIQCLYVGWALVSFVAVFALAGPIVGIVFGIASPFGFIWTSYVSAVSARGVLGATSTVAANRPDLAR